MCDTNDKRYTRKLFVSAFIFTACFNLAHWSFAYNYWQLSLRVFLMNNNKPKDLYDKHFMIVNTAVSVFTVVMPLIALFCALYEYYRFAGAFQTISTFMLLLYCCFLFDGLVRLARLVKED